MQNEDFLSHITFNRGRNFRVSKLTSSISVSHLMLIQLRNTSQIARIKKFLFLCLLFSLVNISCSKNINLIFCKENWPLVNLCILQNLITITSRSIQSYCYQLYMLRQFGPNYIGSITNHIRIQDQRSYYFIKGLQGRKLCYIYSSRKERSTHNPYICFSKKNRTITKAVPFSAFTTRYNTMLLM